MTDPTEFTVIIPAHNEEAVIGRCLQTIMRAAPLRHSMQLIVAANGCCDRTVEVARATAPEALVLDIAEGSKPGAMNAAGAYALHFPRIYLDADVQCDYRSLEAVAKALRQPGVMAASPSLRMDFSRSNWLIKAYYRVWLTQPYVNRNMVGSGCYGLSRSAFEEIGPFPSIIGDDIWVHSRFREDQRRNVQCDDAGKPVYFTVSPPTTATDQIRVETRRRLGNLELRQQFPSPYYAGSNSAGDLPSALSKGASAIDIGVYLGIKSLARVRSQIAWRRSKTIVWERDEAARQA